MKKDYRRTLKLRYIYMVRCELNGQLDDTGTAYFDSLSQAKKYIKAQLREVVNNLDVAEECEVQMFDFDSICTENPKPIINTRDFWESLDFDQESKRRFKRAHPGRWKYYEVRLANFSLRNCTFCSEEEYPVSTYVLVLTQIPVMSAGVAQTKKRKKKQVEEDIEFQEFGNIVKFPGEN